MAQRDVVVVGASAGGVEALTDLARSLPGDFAAAILVVLHVPRTATTRLPEILDRAGPLPAALAEHDAPIVPGRFYVAPADFHLVVRDGRLRLGRGPLENGHRPAIDPLFRTAARAFGRRAIGVILSGTLDDGTAGIGEVRARGGLAVVQEPADALYGGMAQSAIQNVGVDHVAPASAIGELLTRLTGDEVDLQPTTMGAGLTEDPEHSGADLAELEPSAVEGDRPGAPSPFACPDCNGVLWEDRERQPLHFRCRVGHAWSAESLAAQHSEQLEGAMWATLRTLQEKAALSRRLAERARSRGHVLSAERFDSQAEEAEQTSRLIEKVIAAGTISAPISEGELGDEAGAP